MKYSDKIPETDIESVIEGTATTQQIAEKNNVPSSAVDNKKRRTVEKKKLSVGFAGFGADKGLPDNKVLTNNATDDSKQPVQEVPLDATQALKGFWSMVDMMLRSAGWLTKGQLEYTPLTEKDIQELAEVSNTNAGMRKLATFQGVDYFTVIGYAGLKFAPRIKMNLKPKHDDKAAKEMKCNCEECKKKIEKAKEIYLKLKEQNVKQVDQTDKKLVEQKTEVEKVVELEATTPQSDLKQFLQRNLGSDPNSLKQADAYIKKMQEENPSGLRITP